MNREIEHIRGDLRVRYGQGSRAGLKSGNDDALGIRIPDGLELATKGIAVVIADGVSAAEAGGEAAQLGVLGFLNDYYSTPDTWGVKTAGHRVLVSINRWLYGEGRRFVSESKGYIAAMSTLVIKSRVAHIFHAGDTRIYRLSGGQFEQITSDHSTRVSSETSYLNRALGLSLDLQIDYHSFDTNPGDVFFLSTDGIHDYLRREEIAEHLKNGTEDPDKVCERLIDCALKKGSRDNLSCQIVCIEDLETEDKADVYQELGQLLFPPDLDKGMVFEGYRIERLMHASSRSQLYLARDVDTDELLVIKTPSINYQDDAAYIDRFLMEEWVGRRLSSRHLIKMLRKKRADSNVLYHVMEYVEGRSVRDWIRCNTQPSVKEVVEIMEGIIEGLRVMHKKETLHGDLKPDNVMIATDGTPRIIDFGSAYVVGMREIALPFERGTALGTERYSAPEYKLGWKPGTQSDLFSLAMITYEMLTHGRQPFGEKFQKAKTVRDFDALKYEPASLHNPLVPGWVDGALCRALSWDATKRQSRLSEFLADLKRPNPTCLLPSEASLWRKDKSTFWKGLCGILALTIVVLIYFILKN